MKARGLTALAVVAVVAVGGALFIGSRRDHGRDESGKALLPGLDGELASLDELDVIKGGAAPSVTLKKIGDGWVVRQRNDYPADVSKLRKLLLALGDTRIVEEKTSDPANYPAIGVEDPSKPGASGTGLAWTAADGRHELIVGKAAALGSFVRLDSQARSELVAPSISIDVEPRFWIDSRLTDVPLANVQRIEVKPAEGGGYTLTRASAKDATFTLAGVPAGRKALDAAALAPSPSFLGGLTVEDVAAASTVDFGKATVVTVTLSDGNVLTLTGASAGDKHWVTIGATKDAALNARAQGRAYELAAYRYQAIFRPLEELLVPKSSPVASKPAATTAGHAAHGKTSSLAHAPGANSSPR